MKAEDIVKKSLLFGVGIAAVAQEKAEQVAKELLKRGHINKAEGKRLVTAVAREAGQSGKRIAKVVQSELQRVAKAAKRK